MLLLLPLGALADCDWQSANWGLVCNDECQYVSQVSSTGCGWLDGEPCYHCCWNTCQDEAYTYCGTNAGGKRDYEWCASGGACLVGHCPFIGGGGDDDDSSPHVLGASLGTAGGMILCLFIAACVCKKRRDQRRQNAQADEGGAPSITMTEAPKL